MNHKHSRRRRRQSKRDIEDANGANSPNAQRAKESQKTRTRHKHSRRKDRQSSGPPNTSTAQQTQTQTEWTRLKRDCQNRQSRHTNSRLVTEDAHKTQQTQTEQRITQHRQRTIDVDMDGADETQITNKLQWTEKEQTTQVQEWKKTQAATVIKTKCLKIVSFSINDTIGHDYSI